MSSQSMHKRVQLSIFGTVQGVGFRPFIYHLAQSCSLNGWVCNNAQGVQIDVEGSPESLKEFFRRLYEEQPVNAVIQSVERVELDVQGATSFDIKDSSSTEDVATFILPDIATCSACLAEIFDHNDRRYLYPFTNCTHCGPRYSIVRALPYDRSQTTMSSFPMCADCLDEYANPLDRRFHAQPNACPVCGPQLAFWDTHGQIRAVKMDALHATVDALQTGAIVAIKGLGGYHLMCDATDSDAVLKLRERKQREEKPLALMFASLESIEEYCVISDAEAALLCTPAAPIVLVQKRNPPQACVPLAEAIAPGLREIGAMLPTTPLHHILMHLFNRPLVATSGNLSDEPICIDDGEALQRLKGIADYYCVHNRPIVRPIDDSVVRIVADRPMVLRRARGYAPNPVCTNLDMPPILGVGSQQKNTVALGVGSNVIVSQHIGDLDSPSACALHTNCAEDLTSLYDKDIYSVAVDPHPDYYATRKAGDTGLRVEEVYHHHAHICACMAENQLDEKVLGLSWDGTGLGPDQTIWGGEFLICTMDTFQRVGTFRQMPLPGGEAAVKEPCRIALGLLYTLFGEQWTEYSNLPSCTFMSDHDRNLMISMLTKNINTPYTSSAGRLFDGVASLIGLRHHVHYEGQAAVLLEAAIADNHSRRCYPYSITIRPAIGTEPHEGCYVYDWQDTVKAIIKDYYKQVPMDQIAACFHNTLIQVGVDIVRRVGIKKVVLSGGCFQNRYLTEGFVKTLREEGFEPYWHQNIPPNDGGIALGQVVSCAYRLKKTSERV